MSTSCIDTIKLIVVSIVINLTSGNVFANDAAKNTLVPFIVSSSLFDHNKSETLGLSRVPNTETFTIFSPDNNTDKYSHGVVLFGFKNKLYAQWQSSATDEDASDSKIMFSHSIDGQHWSEEKILVPQWDKGIRTNGGWWSDGETLVAYINVWPTPVKGQLKGGYSEYIMSHDGVNWSAPQKLLRHDGTPINGVFEQDPLRLPNGRIVNAIHEQPGIVVSPYYTDDPLGVSGWKKGKMENLAYKPPTSRSIEPSAFYQADGDVIMTFRDQASSFKVLASISHDNGISWTKPVLTNMPDSRSKKSAGNLPSGVAYMVNNPKHNKQRFPLVITLSKRGETFDRAYLLRAGGNDMQTLRYPGKYKRVGFSYPKSTIWKDHIYVSYATNKEDVELTRVPLTELQY